MRWWWPFPAKPKPKSKPQWYVHYQGFGEPEYVSPPMTEDEAQDELNALRQFQLTFPPQAREFQTENGPVFITSFTGCRAWTDTK